MQGSRASLYLGIAASVVALLAAAFHWTLVDRVPALIFMPLTELASVVPLAAATLAAVVALVRARGLGRASRLALLVCSAAWIALATVPFTRIWLALNFRWHAAARERIVAEIASGKLKPNVDYNGALIALGPGEPHVSAGGNDVVVEMREAGRPWVLFFTFRGVLNHYSGFLHVPDGGDPAAFGDLARRKHQVVRYAPGWYFVAR